MAGRIRHGGVASDGESLATASAEVDLAPIAGATGLLHPSFASEGLEGCAMAPNIREGAFAQIVEDEAGKRLRGVAGQHAPRGRDDDDRASPAPHARLRQSRVVIVDDKIEIQNSGKTFLRLSTMPTVSRNFSRVRNQRGPVPLRPRIILNMRDLEALRADFNRKVDNRGKMVDILTMNRRIDRKTDTELARPSRDVALFLQASFIAGDSIGVFRNDVLKRNLHVIQPDRGEPLRCLR